MKVAFTHNLRLTDSEQEAEFDTAETVDAIAAAIEAAGHEVEKIEVSGPASNLLERLESLDPDIVFNTAEGSGGRMREAFYPALFEELSVPYTGSDAYTNALTLDKWLTKFVVSREGIDTPRAVLITPGKTPKSTRRGALGSLSRSSSSPTTRAHPKASVTTLSRAIPIELESILTRPEIFAPTPTGFSSRSTSPGVDVAVGYIHGIGHDGGLLHARRTPGRVRPKEPAVQHLRLPPQERRARPCVQFRCPAAIPRDVAARMRSISLDVIALPRPARPGPHRLPNRRQRSFLPCSMATRSRR